MAIAQTGVAKSAASELRIDIHSNSKKLMKLPSETHDELQNRLHIVAMETSSPLVFLTDFNGNAFSYFGDRNFLQNGTLPILIANSFAATFEIFNLASGRTIRSTPQLLLEGDTMSIFSTLIDKPLLLSILFTSKTTFGQVQMSAKKACDAFEKLRYPLPERVTTADIEKRVDQMPVFLKETQRQIENLFRQTRKNGNLDR